MAILPKEEDEVQAGFSASQIEGFSTRLAAALSQADGAAAAMDMIRACGEILEFEAALCVVNRRDADLVYLCDSFDTPAAKQAVQRYVKGTYLLNPVHNAFHAGLAPGLYRMSELAPDAWGRPADLSAFEVSRAGHEEIGYRTHGWPAGLQELVLAVALPEGELGEISFARPASEGGFTDAAISQLAPFFPLLSAVFLQLWQGMGKEVSASRKVVPLEAFGRDRLSPREAEVVQMVLRGHSSQSISLTLDIALTTVKTHRKNAYAKLGIATQQELFTAFLVWQQGKG